MNPTTPKQTRPAPKANHPTTNTRPELANLLAGCRTLDGQPKYGIVQNKPVIFIDVKTVLNDKSDKFQDKLLCDGLTMNAGDACVFSCTFCYVPEAMLKLHSAMLAGFNRETGLDLDLSQVVIRRRGFLVVLKRQLLHPDGSRIYDDPDDQRGHRRLLVVPAPMRGRAAGLPCRAQRADHHRHVGPHRAIARS